MDFSKIKKIYIVGIEGSGTSALARMLQMKGKVVLGSDEGDHLYYDMLESQNIEVFHKFDAVNLPHDVDLVVHSTAHRVEVNQELIEANRRGLKILTYAEVMAEIFNQKYGIAVCGSHGKTTTSAWLAFVLREAQLSPSAIIGSKVPQFNGSTLVGDSDYFVFESDEYQNKLRYYKPKIILLNNIEYDHPDFFPTPDDYLQVFIDFIARLPKKGLLITNFDDNNIASIANVNCLGRVISYAINNDADYVAYDIRNDNGKQYFKVRFDDGELGEFCIQLFGRHNIYNALAVIATCVELDVELVDIRKYLEDFSGTNRRAQVLGEFNGATIIDDYAHHPAEIKTTLTGLREIYPNRKLTCVFHPHSFSRTKALLDDFAQSFGDCDRVIILDIYGSAREQSGDVHSRDLVEKITRQDNMRGKEIMNIENLEKCEKYLRENISRGEVVVLMGAGDVYKIGNKLIGN